MARTAGITGDPAITSTAANSAGVTNADAVDGLRVSIVSSAFVILVSLSYQTP